MLVLCRIDRLRPAADGRRARRGGESASHSTERVQMIQAVYILYFILNLRKSDSRIIKDGG